MNRSLCYKINRENHNQQTENASKCRGHDHQPKGEARLTFSHHCIAVNNSRGGGRRSRNSNKTGREGAAGKPSDISAHQHADGCTGRNPKRERQDHRQGHCVG